MQPAIGALFDDTASTVSYVVAELAGRGCAIIDPVLDYDPESGRTATASTERIGQPPGRRGSFTVRRRRGTLARSPPDSIRDRVYH